MSSTCFEPEGSSSGRRLYVQVWTAYTDACKTHHTIIVQGPAAKPDDF